MFDLAAKYGATSCKEKISAKQKEFPSGWIPPNTKLLAEDITTQNKGSSSGGGSMNLKGDSHFTLHL